MAKAHTGHLTGPTRSRRRCSASSASPGSTASTSCSTPRPRSPARPARRRGDGVCVYSISGGTGAHMADLVAGRRAAAARARRRHADARCTTVIPAYLRVSNPVDSGGPPVADARGRKILDAIVADPNVDVLIVPITGALAMFSEPFTRDLVDVAETTDKPIFVVWGSPPGTDDTYYLRLLDGGLPVFRTFGNCVQAVRPYFDYWTFAARLPLAVRQTCRASRCRPRAEARAPARPGAAGGTLSEHASKQLLAAYGIRTSRDVLCDERRRSGPGRRRRSGYPVVMKVVVARAAAQERPRAGAGRRERVRRGRRVLRRADADARRAAAGDDSRACSCARW